MSVVGLEPTTTRLKVGYSTTELHARVCLTLLIIDHSPDECKRVRAQFWLSWPVLANVILIRNILADLLLINHFIDRWSIIIDADNIIDP